MVKVVNDDAYENVRQRKELKDLTFRLESAKSVRLELEQRVKDLQGQNAGLDGNQFSSKLGMNFEGC